MSDKTFSYTYSAKQQEEIKKIRDKYAEGETDKMELLRKLDASTTKKSTMYSIIIGVVGTLIFGAGMSMAMVWTDTLLILGILIGVVGIVIIAFAYPVYNYITKIERKKVAPQIIELTNELMK
ncbi:MAG: MFS transporter [Lachnospira sp.]|nr:MFS transporter [Lachnospira sp.]